MDEATLKRIVGIVKNMQAGGMNADEIKDNLRQMGISDEELDAILTNAGITVSAPAISEPVVDSTQHEEHFERLHSTVGELHDKHEDLKGSLDDVAGLRREIQEIKAEINEIKPLIGAIKRINENLIEINKKMLVRLETR